MGAEFPITRNLAEAFADAVAFFDFGWDVHNPDVTRISIEGRGYSVRGVCGLVDGFDDELPEGVTNLLFKQMHAQHGELRADLAKSLTYAVGARCLMELLNDRIADYERRQRARREKGLD